MVNRDDTPDYEALAARLDRWRQVPTDVLTDVVVDRGLCWWGLWPAQELDWDDDRDLAVRLCAGCPVINQCLELDLRTAGAGTTGVWGALPEDDRRALYPIWRRRRHQHDTAHQEGGSTP
ncbi:MAG: WhiB family transcriptional regulator [Actinomycetota bacterium]|nr:WhiB family transcriptional regulator [Actinomycetota bacterium]